MLIVLASAKPFAPHRFGDKVKAHNFPFETFYTSILSLTLYHSRSPWNLRPEQGAWQDQLVPLGVFPLRTGAAVPVPQVCTMF